MYNQTFHPPQRGYDSQPCVFKEICGAPSVTRENFTSCLASHKGCGLQALC